MRFALFFYADEAAWRALPESERSAAAARIGAWYGEQARAGRIVGGCQLTGRDTAVTVRLGPAARPTAPVEIPGPHGAEREALSAYAIVEAHDQEAALVVARGWPGGGAVEVRPLAEG